MSHEHTAYMPRIALAEAARDALAGYRDALRAGDDARCTEMHDACLAYSRAYARRYGRPLTFVELADLERLNEQMKRHRMNRAQVIRELVEQRVNELAGKEPA